MQKTSLKFSKSSTDSEDSDDQSLVENDNDGRISDEDFPISDEEVEDDESKLKNSGWQKSMAKILNSNKSEILSKAKKIEDIQKKKQKKSLTFEIEVDGEVKEEKNDEKPSEQQLLNALKNKKRREKRENKFRVFNLRIKPSVSDLDRERTFRKIATRGVVQLFNAVKNQQSDLEKKLQFTKLESKRDEIIRSTDNKKNFLNTLMTGSRAMSELIDKNVKKEKMEDSSDEGDDDDDDQLPKKSNWSALRDDFITGKNVGWDKDSGSEENQSSMEDEDSE